MRKLILASVLAIVIVISGCSFFRAEATFQVTVSVLSSSVTPIAPLAYAVHTKTNPLYSPGTDERIEGLEALAEDGDPSTAASSLESADGVTMSGAADTPDGESAAAPAGPGASYTFTFSAREGEKLSFATMYVQSNDLFFGPDDSGIDLFPNGVALDGDITSMIMLYDAGTEVNEEPGVGANQAPRQTGPNTGADEGGNVQLIADAADGFTYPAVSAVIAVTITPN